MLSRLVCAFGKLRPQLLFAIIAVLSTGALAQSPTLAAINPRAFASGSTSNVTRLPDAPSPQRFWDRENQLLFLTAGAFSAGDFAVTRSVLANRGRELNPLVRPFAGSTTGLAANFSAQTAGVIGISYMFHRTGHHRLERITPLVDIAGSAVAVGYGLSHR